MNLTVYQLWWYNHTGKKYSFKWTLNIVPWLCIITEFFSLSRRKTAKKSWTLLLVLLSIIIWMHYGSYFVCTVEKRKWVNISMLLGTYVFIVRNKVLVRNEWRCMDGIVALSVSLWFMYIYVSALSTELV